MAYCTLVIIIINRRYTLCDIRYGFVWGNVFHIMVSACNCSVILFSWKIRIYIWPIPEGSHTHKAEDKAVTIINGHVSGMNSIINIL